VIVGFFLRAIAAGGMVLAAQSAVAQVGAATASGLAAPSAVVQDGEIHKHSRDAAIVRGGVAYKTYCVLCHGAGAEGNGRAARLYTPPPANLVTSTFNDDYWELMIRRGGAGMGRSGFMPPWGDQLTDEQIRDLVVYLRSMSRTR
jgi:mono/diheme cytochrome c family protein